MPEAAAHKCSYPPHGDLLGRPDDRCVTCEQQRLPSRMVAVDEAFLRRALRDAACFAEYHATAGDPDSPRYIREYEVALLELADAPVTVAVDPADLQVALDLLPPRTIAGRKADALIRLMDAAAVAK